MRWRNVAACCAVNELYKCLPFYVVYFTIFNVEAVMEQFTGFVSRNFGTLFVKTTCNRVLTFAPLQQHHWSVNTNFRKSRVSQCKKQHRCIRTLAHLRTTHLHMAETSVAISCLLDGSGFEYRYGKDFPHPSRPVQWATPSPVQWVQGLSRGELAEA